MKELNRRATDHIELKRKTDDVVSRHEFDILTGMVQDHHKRLREMEKFVEMSPDTAEHHDDHIFVQQSREKMKVFTNSMLDNAGRLAFLILTTGFFGWIIFKTGIIKIAGGS